MGLKTKAMGLPLVLVFGRARGHVCPAATAAEPGWALRLMVPRPLRSTLSRHCWAHFLLHLLPPACGLGPVTSGELQEAGVKGASSPCD